MEKKRDLLSTILVFIFLILAWETYSRLNTETLFIIPAPSYILECFFTRFDRLLFHTYATAKEMAGAMLIALSVAFPIAWGMYLHRFLRSVLHPLFVIIQCIPMFTLAPIMVFWFDWSYKAIVIPTALMIFFPLTINIYQGLCSTPSELLDYFRVNQATKMQTFFKLQLPWSMPHLIAGFRISTAIAGIGAVAGEWAGAQEGLGILMLESRRSTDLGMTFAALLCLTILSLGLYGLSFLFEQLLVTRRRLQLFQAFKKYYAFCLIPVVLTSCQQTNEKKNDLPVTHIILDWLPNPNHIPLFVGIEKGFFNEKGINLKLTKITDPGDTISYITSKKVDLALYYMPEMYLAMQQGANLVPVGFLIKDPLNAFIYRKESGITTVKDMNDKRIGYVVGGFGVGLMNRLLTKNKIRPAEKFNVSFDLVGAMGSKRVDVLYGAYWNIESEHLRSLGVDTDYFSLEEMGYPKYYELLIIANKDTPYASAEFVENFKSALQASIDYSKKNPEEAFAIYKSLNPDKGEKTLSWEKEAWLKTLPVFAVDQVNEESVWNNFEQWIKGF